MGCIRPCSNLMYMYMYIWSTKVFLVEGYHPSFDVGIVGGAEICVETITESICPCCTVLHVYEVCMPQTIFNLVRGESSV